MDEELVKRARALLELRDKAMPVGNRTAPEAVIKRTIANIDFRSAAHEMADTIADLLAANERLSKREAALSEATVVARGFRADCSAIVANHIGDLQARIGELEERASDLQIRAEAAEAKLNELADSEPVAWLDVNRNWWRDRKECVCDNPLPVIRRPEKTQ